MLVLVDLEFCADLFQNERPFLLQIVVLFKASANMALILLVVLGDLRLTFLEDFDFETTLARPLLSQVLVKLLD